MLREALGYPLESEDLTREYSIAVLLTLGSILVVPAFILIGYYLKTMRETLEGKNQIPQFEDYGTLLGDGLRFFGLIVVYTFVIILPVATINSLGAAIGLTDITAVIDIIFVLGALYLVPASMVNFARKNSFRAAFDMKHVRKIAGRKQYIRGIAGLVGGSILIGIGQLTVTFALMITLVGIPALIVVIPAMQFYEQLFYFRYIPQFCRTQDSN